MDILNINININITSLFLPVDRRHILAKVDRLRPELAIHIGILRFWSKIRIINLDALRDECIRVMLSDLATSDNMQAAIVDCDSM
jgi:hypothetical protein